MVKGERLKVKGFLVFNFQPSTFNLLLLLCYALRLMFTEFQNNGETHAQTH